MEFVSLGTGSVLETEGDDLKTSEEEKEEEGSVHFEEESSPPHETIAVDGSSVELTKRTSDAGNDTNDQNTEDMVKYSMENNDGNDDIIENNNGNNHSNNKNLPYFGDIVLDDDNNDKNNEQTDNSNIIKGNDGRTINFLEDDPSQMTYSRRIALYMMKHYKWYNPRLEKNKARGLSFGTFVKEGSFRTPDGYPLQRSVEETPSLEKAWAYYEHSLLPRYIYDPKKHHTRSKHKKRNLEGNNNDQQQEVIEDISLLRAEPGENRYETRLYHPLFTHQSQLGDFGIGVGIYFSTLKFIAVLFLLAGLINIPNFMYYDSNQYSVGKDENESQIPLALRASAVCTDQQWVPCPSCEIRGSNQTSFPPDRIAYGYNETTKARLIFAKKNFCNGATIQQGLVNYFTLIFISVGIIIFNRSIVQQEIEFDVDEQTTQDYSIVIKNPPIDAYEPKEFKDFLENAFSGVHVTCCTVVIDNDVLLRNLVKRRETMKEIEISIPPGTNLDMKTLSTFANKEKKKRNFVTNFMSKFFSPGLPELYDSLVKTTKTVQDLIPSSSYDNDDRDDNNKGNNNNDKNHQYPVAQVFVTFETEADQRRVLKAMSVGRFQAIKNDKSVFRRGPDGGNSNKYLFRGEHVLLIREAEEPNTILWQELNTKFVEKVKIQLCTSGVTFAALIVTIFVVRYCIFTDNFLAAYIISIFNSIFPLFASFLMTYESHSSESHYQASFYSKVAFFRFVNTAVVLTIVTHFTYTLSEDDLIENVRKLFYAEISTNIFLQITDFPFITHFKRHILAPRAKTQDSMNLLMHGTKMQLSERYTNVTKIMFLAMWYSALYPIGLLLCCFALFINYYADRFSVMLQWMKAPDVGTQCSKLSRRYFFPISILSMAFMSSYYYSGFPYDLLCREGNGLFSSIVNSTSPYLGYNNNVTLFDIHETTTEEIINVNIGDPIYEHCLQDYIRTNGRQQFPFVSKFQKSGDNWMTKEQEFITDLYGWTVIAVLITTILTLLTIFRADIMNLFANTYEPRGTDQGIPFSTCASSVSGYIPQVESNVYPFPLIAVKGLDDIDLELLMGWTDHYRSHAFYDLTRDAEMIIQNKEDRNKSGRNNYNSDENDKNNDTHGHGDDATKNVKSKVIVFSQIAHWPPPATSAGGDSLLGVREH